VMENANATSSSRQQDVSGVTADAHESFGTESSGKSGKVSTVLSKLEEMAIDDKIQVKMRVESPQKSI
jgi:hypothetical protein